MNQAASFHSIATFPPQTGRGPALGWGISLLVHALAVACLWHAWRSRPVDTDTGPVGAFEVRLIPLTRETPQERREPAAAPVPAARPRPEHALPARAAPRPAPPATPSNPTAPEALPDTPAAAAAAGAATDTITDTPSVDLASARAAARMIARKNRKGLVALPERKTVVDPNADRHVVDPIEASRRIDCQTARSQSTNLLANVVMLAVDLTKNAIDDSGCKWR
jgi:hypothetical protein